MTRLLKRAHNYEDLRELARRRLPRGLFEFIDRGAEDEVALRHNRASFERIKLVPRTLNGVAAARLDTQLFGRALPMPIAIAPTGVMGMVWPDGEATLARAAAEAGIPYGLSTASLSSLEDVARGAGGGELWFQLYVWNRLEQSLALMDRARDAGYRVLIVTADSATGPNREYNLHNHFTVPMKLTPKAVLGVLRRPGWIARVMIPTLLSRGIPGFANYPPEYRANIFGRGGAEGMAALGPPVVTRDMLCRLRDHWKGPLIVKGLLAPEDAEAAIACGADGVIVSNHGGRTLDATISAIDALPAIVAAVGGRGDVLMDSGIRRGSDIAKALALGAKVVLVGRMPIWGAAVAGVPGALHSIGIIRAELARVMVQLGCAGVGDIGPHCLWNGTGPQGAAAAPAAPTTA